MPATAAPWERRAAERRAQRRQAAKGQPPRYTLNLTGLSEELTEALQARADDAGLSIEDAATALIEKGLKPTRPRDDLTRLLAGADGLRRDLETFADTVDISLSEAARRAMRAGLIEAARLAGLRRSADVAALVAGRLDRKAATS